MEAGDIAVIPRSDAETVQRALQALSTEPFFAIGQNDRQRRNPLDRQANESGPPDRRAMAVP